jgi:hypothetical protein
MRRYLVLFPSGSDAESFLEQLERLAAQQPTRFHVVALRQPESGGAGEVADEQRLLAVVRALAARGLSADGEVGGRSVVGSVATAAEGARYDAVVVPVPDTGGLETLNLDVARRLHQIEIPDLVLVTPRAKRSTGNAPNSAVADRGRPRFTPRSGLIVGGVLVALLAVLAAILVHRHVPAPALWVRVGVRPAATAFPTRSAFVASSFSCFGHDDDRTTGVVGEVIAHAVEQAMEQAAVALVPDDDEVGVLVAGRLEQGVDSVQLGDDRPVRDSGVAQRTTPPVVDQMAEFCSPLRGREV